VARRRHESTARTYDDELSCASLADVRRYAEAHPETQLIPCHDPDLWR